MPVQLENVNPEFRQLTDLLFFSDRMDLDLSKFKSLLKENLEVHFEYVWDRFCKSSEIYWVNGEQFWSHRLAFLLSLNEKTVTKRVEEHLEKRMFHLVNHKFSVDIKYDIQYLQFLELCKVKRARHEDLSNVEDYLTDMPSHVTVAKLVSIVNSFIPICFESLDHYAEVVGSKVTSSYRHFDLLLELEKHGCKLDRDPLIKLAHNLIQSRGTGNGDKGCRTFFYIIKDEGIMAGLKKEYGPNDCSFLRDLVAACDFRLLEDQHMANIKNLLELDTSLAEDIACIYADKLYLRKASHKKANADRLIRLARTFPQIGPKKILSYLSHNNRMTDIKYICSAFPELAKLAAFV